MKIGEYEDPRYPPDPMLSAEHGGTDALDQPGVRQQVVLVGQVLGDDRADVGQVVRNPLLDPLHDLTAEQVVHRVEVIADRPRVRHRTDQAEMIRDLRELRMQFRKVHAGHLRRNRLVRATDLERCLGLEVPGVDVARSATEQHEDAAFLGGHRVSGRIEAVLAEDEPGHREIEEAQAAGLERGPPRLFWRVFHGTGMGGGWWRC